ncbi:hypothetical protein WCD74_29180 [Actinomycetospora sp. OC33-EN08]|uniref:SnoaL-like domain-containing protein n=1 Tax=Actinomycetospora aurantiaca TaxID=3129233 RepID=A0ABU8MX22_9PSEU
MTEIESFFDGYTKALLARDERAVAALYAVPALVLFPGQSVAVSDVRQTEAFWASAWDQYGGVAEALPEVAVIADAGFSVWADVTWRHDGVPSERFVYQLVRHEDGWRIAVLTAMALGS